VDCRLVAHGLLKASFVPDRAQRELRELVRYRTTLIQERTAACNRLQKVLEGANIKLASVATDILGRSGREMLSALVGGETDPAVLAELAQGKLRQKLPALQRALLGQFGTHQRFLVAEILARVDFLDERIASQSQEIVERERPFEEAMQHLDTIPCVGQRIAEILVAELGGDDVGRFASARHLASWVGLCPGQNESAGKQRSSTIRKGNRWLRSVLVEVAYAARRSKDTYLSAQFARIAARRGVKRAAVAVAHSILVIVYHLLGDRHDYLDLGPTYFDQRECSRITRRLQARLERLGYRVQLEAIPSAASRRRLNIFRPEASVT
jgi:transposase